MATRSRRVQLQVDRSEDETLPPKRRMRAPPATDTTRRSVARIRRWTNCSCHSLRGSLYDVGAVEQLARSGGPWAPWLSCELRTELRPILSLSWPCGGRFSFPTPFSIHASLPPGASLELDWRRAAYPSNASRAWRRASRGRRRRPTHPRSADRCGARSSSTTVGGVPRGTHGRGWPPAGGREAGTNSAVRPAGRGRGCWSARRAAARRSGRAAGQPARRAPPGRRTGRSSAARGRPLSPRSSATTGPGAPRGRHRPARATPRELPDSRPAATSPRNPASPRACMSSSRAARP